MLPERIDGILGRIRQADAGKKRVLVTVPHIEPGDEADSALRLAGLEAVYSPDSSSRTEDETISLVRGIVGAIIEGDTISTRVIDAADQLQVICRTGSGYNHIDVAAATARGIVVCTASDNRRAVAEYTLALMLMLSRRLLENLMDVRAGGWRRCQGSELGGKTLGIVGLGAIGKEVARRARVFDMRLLANDVVRDEQFAAEHRVSYVSLEELLRQSDYVTLHQFLDRNSRQLIDADRLALMKPGAYLVSVAWGGMVDSRALCAALKEKRLAGAALDAFETEPLPADSPLRELDNLLLSPHCAGWTVEAQRSAALQAAENVVRVLRGEPPHSCVNPEVLGRL